jgi:hypothetical protein
MPCIRSGGSPTPPTPSPQFPRPIILDTDPGLDDAIAVLLALRAPELKVEAITTVAGNVPVELGTENALKLVELTGRTDVIVAKGAARPLRRKLITARSFLQYLGVPAKTREIIMVSGTVGAGLATPVAVPDIHRYADAAKVSLSRVSQS